MNKFGTYIHNTCISNYEMICYHDIGILPVILFQVLIGMEWVLYLHGYWLAVKPKVNNQWMWEEGNPRTEWNQILLPWIHEYGSFCKLKQELLK